jgi:hypothetical protein
LQGRFKKIGCFFGPLLRGPMQTSLRSIIGTQSTKKIFSPWGQEQARCRRQSDEALQTATGAQVFWFFFAKKNCLPFWRFS